MTALLAILALQVDPEKAIRDALPDLAKGSYAASERLAALGPSALPALRKAAEAAAEPAKRLLRLACDEIETSEALQDLYLPPKRFTLVGEKRSLVGMLADLRRDSGLLLDFSELTEDGGDKEISIDLKDGTFFQALDALCKAGDLRAFDSGSELYITRETYDGAPRFFYRNFMVALTEFERTRAYDFRSAPRRYFRVTLDVWWDDRARPCGSKTRVELDAAEDDKGKSLLLPAEKEEKEPEREAESFWVGDSAWYDSVETPPMALPSEGATKIALRGSVLLEFPKSFETFRWDKLEAKSSRDGADFSAVLNGYHFGNRAQHRVDLTLRCKKADAREVVKKPMRFRITLKSGATLNGWGRALPVSDSEIALSLDFDQSWAAFSVGPEEEEEEKDQEAVSLTVVVVKEVLVKRIPFEFRDVELK